MFKNTIRPESGETMSIVLKKLIKAKDSKCLECTVRYKREFEAEPEPGLKCVVESISEIKICTDTLCFLYPIVWVPILNTMGKEINE